MALRSPRKARKADIRITNVKIENICLELEEDEVKPATWCIMRKKSSKSADVTIIVTATVAVIHVVEYRRASVRTAVRMLRFLKRRQLVNRNLQPLHFSCDLNFEPMLESPAKFFDGYRKIIPVKWCGPPESIKYAA